MTPVVLIVLGMVFAAIVFTIYGFVFYFRGRKESDASRIQARLGMSQEEEEETIGSLLREQAADSALERLGNLGESMQLAIQQAGMKMTVSTLISQMVVLGFAAMLGLGIFLGARWTPLAILVAWAPYKYVQTKASSRAKKLLSQLPDCLEMMGRAMQTGAGLIDCFRLVQMEMQDPVAGEFGQVSEQVRFGKDWRLALEELINRNPSLFDLRLLVSSLLMQKETGGNMIETVNRISKLIRSRYAFDSKVVAMTSEAKASGFILAMMPLCVLTLMFLANPDYLEPLWSTMVGQIVCVYAVGSYGSGIYIMMAMSKVEV